MKKLIFSLLTLTSLKSLSQEAELSSSQLNINAFAPSISYELQLSRRKSIALTGGLGFIHLTREDASGNSSSNLYFNPLIHSTYRTYFKRRRVRKNNLRNNSGNYIGYFGGYSFKALGNYEFTPSLEGGSYAFGVVWGMQRNYASGIHFGFSIGPGYEAGPYVKNGFAVVGEIEIGLILFSN